MKALLEVFYQPGKLFESLAERKNAWVAPLVAGIGAMLLMSAVLLNSIGMPEIIRQRMAAAGKTAEQIQQALARADSPGQVSSMYGSVVVGVPLALLVVTGALTVFAMMSRTPPKFGTVFAMVAYSFFPYWFLTSLIAIVTLFLMSDKAAIDVSNLAATNVAAYVDRASVSKGLYSLYGSLDVLSFTVIGLMGFGFSKVARVSLFYGMLAVLTVWALYVPMKVGMSLLN